MCKRRHGRVFYYLVVCHLSWSLPTLRLLLFLDLVDTAVYGIQVCLAALMAQVGAWVPAQSLTLTPVDAIFVRTGAKDDLMAGQSTFFVELAETAAALNRATPASLVALDELGRGTATSDGAAIAAAVLEHLSAQVHCR